MTEHEEEVTSSEEIEEEIVAPQVEEAPEEEVLLGNETTEETEIAAPVAAAIEEKTEPARKIRVSTIVHWVIHVVMAIAIAVLAYNLWFMHTDEGKYSQQYGATEAHEIVTTYANHDWNSMGIDEDTYAYYYDMYAQYFDTYADQYAEMGISNMSELMDTMYEDMVEYYSSSSSTSTSTDSSSTSTSTDSSSTSTSTDSSSTSTSTSTTTSN